LIRKISYTTIIVIQSLGPSQIRLNHFDRTIFDSVVGDIS
jgi:hypothetical protein